MLFFAKIKVHFWIDPVAWFCNTKRIKWHEKSCLACFLARARSLDILLLALCDWVIIFCLIFCLLFCWINFLDLQDLLLPYLLFTPNPIRKRPLRPDLNLLCNCLGAAFLSCCAAVNPTEGALKKETLQETRAHQWGKDYLDDFDDGWCRIDRIHVSRSLGKWQSLAQCQLAILTDFCSWTLNFVNRDSCFFQETW